MAENEKILILRFSAMGDVAMTAPVIKEFCENYPGIELVIVSRKQFRPFFEETPQLRFYELEDKGKHKGLTGLIRLFKTLRSMQITSVADLHNNLRSRVLTTLFRISGIRTVTLDKGRAEKKLLTRKKDKLLIPLKLTVQRYAEVFGRLGYSFELRNTLSKNQSGKQSSKQKWIGISSFAQHKQKIYPLHKIEEVVRTLAELGHRLFIFGGTKEEQQVAENWETMHRNITSNVRKMTLEEELAFLPNLDLMLSMDSSGMHLASLKNIPVVSVWGATHPYTGFLGYGQSINNAVQIELYCRPCSVYGNIPCYRGDFACMNNLPPQNVVNKVLDLLSNG